MKRLSVVFAIVAIVGMLVPVPARAGRACVTYSVTAPAVGTKGGTHCSPSLPPDWDGYESWSSCGGLPPAGTAHCVRLSLYRPI